MSLSLREQLLAAGLVSKKQVKHAGHQQNQQLHQQVKNRTEHISEQQLAVQRAQAAKAARDQELNRQQQIKAEKKARMAQIKQLVEQNRLPKPETDEYYNFVAGKKIRRVAVNTELRGRLTRGEIVIVRCEGRYELVPAAIAMSIKERDEHAIVAYTVAPESNNPEDPYKDFVVPDDLTW